MRRPSAELRIDLKCPKCGHVTKKSLASLKANVEIPCQCGATLRIKGDGFQSAGKALDSFQKKIEGLSTKLKLRF